MAKNQPTRSGAGESMFEFVRRRNREQSAHSLARAAGHQAYGQAIRAKLDLDFPTPADVAAHGAGPAPPGRRTLQPNFFETPAAQLGHPGSAESLIPAWGPGREALADLADGKLGGALFHAGLAGLDVAGIGIVDKALARGGSYAIKGAIGKAAAKAKWRTVRRTMGDLKMLKPYQHGHHWLIPQNGWGKNVPNWIKNHPVNIHGMPSREVHGRLHGRYKGSAQYGVLGHYWHGTPHLSKIAAGSAGGHAVTVAEANGRRQ